MIACYREQQYVGRIVFYPEGSVPMSGQASLHYAFSRFADVLTMLRHAKPLSLLLSRGPLDAAIARVKCYRIVPEQLALRGRWQVPR
jgi:hypothetical protein